MAFPPKKDIQEFQEILLAWFRTHGRSFIWRKSGADLYTKVISEILLQRTRAETVEQFFPAFLTRFPDWASLAVAEESDIQGWLKPIGLWQRRASSIKKLASIIIELGKLPLMRQDIEDLPGVGQYIGNAIELFSQSTPRPLLDVNMARALERYFGPRKLADIRYDPYLQKLASKVVGHLDPVSINWGILDFATKVCKIKNPDCLNCPLSSKCKYFNKNNPSGNLKPIIKSTQSTFPASS